MAAEEEKPRKHSFYDVDRLRQVLADQSSAPPPGRFSPFLRRASLAVDSVRGLISALSGTLLVFGAALSVVIAILYGPLVFLATVGAMLGVFVVYVEHSVGRSLQFGDYPIGRRLVAQLLAFVIAGVLIFLFANFHGLLGF